MTNVSARYGKGPSSTYSPGPFVSCHGCLGWGAAYIFGNIQHARAPAYWVLGERRAPWATFCRKWAVPRGVGDSESGLPARICAPTPAPADSGMLNIPEFARCPLGYLCAKSDHPAEIYIRRDGLCITAAAGALTAHQGLNPRTGYSALLRAPTMSILLSVRLVARLTMIVKPKESTTAST